MDFDIWRYIIEGRGRESQRKGFRLYSIKDMSRMQLPEQWWYALNLHGGGYTISSDLKIRQVLSWTPNFQIFKDGKLVQGHQMPIEKICIDFLRHPCNINNL